MLRGQRRTADANKHSNTHEDNGREPEGGLRVIKSVDKAASEVLPDDLADRVEDRVVTYAQH